MSVFALRGEVSRRTAMSIELIGLLLICVAWFFVTEFQLVPPSLLPPPRAVLTSFWELHFDDALIRNLGYSLTINVAGYLEAIVISVPLGFVVGLFPLFREMFQRYVNAVRFLPLTALTGLFIAWFGIETNMKVQFLAFGITVYLLPVVVQRIYDVQQVYCDTIKTLGATRWQTIKHVFIPDVLSRLIDDVRVLVAISWTYIIVAEMVNRSEGGIGALAYTSARQSRVDKVFAILVVIIVVGFVQDKFMSWLSQTLFPYRRVRGEK